jgi:2-C-methyl-D-erythritol 4-phosphate cytidylyltransferase
MNSVVKPQIHGLVPAGGIGLRAQVAGALEPKQYRLIRGKPMLVWAVQALLADERVGQVVVGVQADDPLAKQYLANLSGTKVLGSAGATRALTVLQTLVQSGFEEHDWVLVHDAARPGLPKVHLSALIDACLREQRGGLLALPAADTVKMARGDHPQAVERTLARETIWLAQTPQMFRVGELHQALSQALQAGVALTDEASAMEWAGQAPLLVEGSLRNHKITWAEDLDWVQRFL